MGTAGRNLAPRHPEDSSLPRLLALPSPLTSPSLAPSPSSMFAAAKPAPPASSLASSTLDSRPPASTSTSPTDEDEAGLPSQGSLVWVTVEEDRPGRGACVPIGSFSPPLLPASPPLDVAFNPLDPTSPLRSSLLPSPVAPVNTAAASPSSLFFFVVAIDTSTPFVQAFPYDQGLCRSL
ncbi:hypothetical protein PLEOSDRAFT_1100169 [Pleurotus ostreatus PC15]|uniref:Uncharacterized protein n=1 Tax=Pleurotus ostreatus (strain PC15) TaxID=1137138 RepID=A0A067P1P2_PLEO1|nr:hypothetical protein PLEOSDRAFT_1100169 [Pleurotus ostreatus PC15]